MLTRIAIAALLCMSMVTSTLARSLTPEEWDALVVTAETMDRNAAEGNHTEQIKLMPPRMIELLASQANASPDVLREEMARQIKQAFELVTLESHEIFLDDAQRLSTPDGTPYVLIPTKVSVIMPDGRKMLSSGNTLALQDNGAWYMLALETDAILPMFRAAYPSFADVDIPLNEVKIVE